MKLFCVFAREPVWRVGALVGALREDLAVVSDRLRTSDRSPHVRVESLSLRIHVLMEGNHDRSARDETFLAMPVVHFPRSLRKRLCDLIRHRNVAALCITVATARESPSFSWAEAPE